MSLNFHELRQHYALLRKPKPYALETAFLGLLGLVLMFCLISGCNRPAWASSHVTIIKGIDTNRLVWAIGKAENSKAHPFGILKHYKHTTPRQACFNTVNHRLKDWNGKGEFIDYLQGFYCPIGSNTDNGTCKYWAHNVKHFYYLKG